MNTIDNKTTVAPIKCLKCGAVDHVVTINHGIRNRLYCAACGERIYETDTLPTMPVSHVSEPHSDKIEFEVKEDGIYRYVPTNITSNTSKVELVMSKAAFIEAFNTYCKQ